MDKFLGLERGRRTNPVAGAQGPVPSSSRAPPSRGIRSATIEEVPSMDAVVTKDEGDTAAALDSFALAIKSLTAQIDEMKKRGF